MRSAHIVSTVLLALAIVGIMVTFGIRTFQTLDMLPTHLGASSELEYLQAQFWYSANTRLTEVLWPTYWILLPIYWLLKTYRDQIVHEFRDAVFLMPCAVFGLLVIDAFGIRTWMWG